MKARSHGELQAKEHDFLSGTEETALDLPFGKGGEKGVSEAWQGGEEKEGDIKEAMAACRGGRVVQGEPASNLQRPPHC